MALLFLAVVCIFVLVLAVPILAWSPVDSFAIDCGSVSNSTATATDTSTQWQGESNSSFASGGVSVAAAAQDPNLPASVPYLTARVFSSRSSYSFPIHPGRHWLRFYFYPFQAAGFDPNKANFSIVVDSYELFSATIVDAVKRSGAVYLVREYSVPSSTTNLTIVFTPATSGSIAFINGIEVMSAPDDALKDDAVLPGQTQQRFGLQSLAFQTMYRINVGGASVNPSNDTQRRSWLPDQKFVEAAATGTATTDFVSSIKYPSTLPEYIAPASVYGTARVLGSSNTVNNNFNLSWNFQVDPGYVYYVRLHFAELVFDATYQRIFNVYINNRTALDELDLMALAPKFTPIYRDIAVPLRDGSTSIRVQMGSTPNSGAQYNDAILNGLEILKMNNTGGSLAEGSFVQLDSGNSGHKSRTTVGAITGIAFGVAAAASALAGLGFVCCRKTKAGKILPLTWRPLPSQPSDVATSLASVGSLPSLPSSTAANSCRHFTFEQMLDATDNFNDELLLGVGGFGKVYKGELDGGLEVAVKRGNPRSEQGLAEFRTEIEMLSQLRHRHLVSLIGYCDENGEMILVYDYMANGPLRGHLYGTDVQPLTWKKRLEICIGAARGLHYLHTGAARAIIHRDVKTTNILLDDNFVAKVADFGLSKIGPSLEHTHVSTAVKGSFGYLDPEYYRRQQLTEKSDVYSFGVVLMEVVCARPAINPALPREQVNIAEWALHWQKMGLLENIMDPKLAGDVTPESLQKFGELAESCLADRGSDRPSMGHVLWNLEYALQLHMASMHSTTLADGGGSQALEVLPLRNYAGDDQVSTAVDFSEINLSTVDATPSVVFSQLVNPRGR